MNPDPAAPPRSLLEDISWRTDAYFNRTREVIARYGDMPVTYAVFLRRPVISAPRLMLDWLAEVAAARGTHFHFDVVHPEGEWVGAGEPIAYITGSFEALSDCETIFLQKLGPACVAAHNAYQMCASLPKTAFLAMEARHCAGAEMQLIMGYAAGVGSDAAKREGATGFVGTSTDMTARLFRRHSRARHHAARPDRLCRLDPARRADVPRDPSRREPDRADRLFRQGDHRRARSLPRLPRPGQYRPARGPARHAWRALPRRARPGRQLRRARAPRARRHPPLPQRHRIARPRRHRRLGRGDLAHARGAGRSRVSAACGSSRRPGSASKNAG